jgi:hypothetical protein
MSKDRQTDAPTDADSTQKASKAARSYFGRKDSSESKTAVETDKAAYSLAEGRRELYQWLKAAGGAAVLTPALFYLRFGEISAFAWGFTVFLVALCLLVGVGYYFSARADAHAFTLGENQTRVAARGGWMDRVGAFWLLACAFGSFFGWMLANAFTLTADNWRWLYWGRVGLSVGLPVLTAFSLLRYVRGRNAPLMLALLLCVTALPVWSCWATMHDLYSGPAPLVVNAITAGRPDEVYALLPHTNRVLARP